MSAQPKTLEIDLKTLKPGTCYIDESLGEKLAVCRSANGKIRIFKVTGKPCFQKTKEK